MTPELTWLTATALITALMWVPYILSQIAQTGLGAALADPQPNTPIETRWAQRAKRAHTNAVENLAIFAPLAIAVSVTGMSSATTAAASAVYFYARAAHFLVYTAGIPGLRTVLFVAGTACQVTLALTLLGWA